MPVLKGNINNHTGWGQPSYTTNQVQPGDVWGQQAWPMQTGTVEPIRLQSETVDLFGSTVQPAARLDYSDGEVLSPTTVADILNRANQLYDSNKDINTLPIYRQVALLRRKIQSNDFNPNRNEELKNILGYILGDLVYEWVDRGYGLDYDQLIDQILASFPQEDMPIEETTSKYASGKSKAGRKSKLSKVAQGVQEFLKKNGLKIPKNESQFIKIWEQFKATKPELDSVDVIALYNVMYSNGATNNTQK